MINNMELTAESTGDTTNSTESFSIDEGNFLLN
jgi:hypothetical protein